ncbi:hypothetical protein K445DRAFT_17344 [Daldinia sp. EC12]|nr:hypothetical protein K445DRAFT_17344 [Daldinia sp. EC12]
MSSTNAPITTGGSSIAGPDRHTSSAVKHSLPMPGLSGSANGPVGNLLKGPVDESGSVVILWSGYIKTEFGDEIWYGDVRMGYRVVSHGVIFHCLSDCQHTLAACLVIIVIHFWALGPKGLLVATTTSLALTFV